MDYHKNLDSLFTRREDGHSNFERYIRELMKSNNAQVLVALDKKDVVGYSISLIQFYPPVFKRSVYGLINDLAVKETHRRKGLGEQMLLKMFQWFTSHGLDRIELRVSVRNKIGYSFWKKHGFKDYQHILYLKK
ncbi:MAG: GNAT family N-acetyltransferase [Promethearchaeota archaeon]